MAMNTQSVASQIAPSSLKGFFCVTDSQLEMAQKG